MIVSKSLSIVWTGPGGFGEEARGIYCYAYLKNQSPVVDNDPIGSIWTSIGRLVAINSTPIVERDSFASVGLGSILACTVRLDQWPADIVWKQSVEATLKHMVENGGSVAWCGGEDCSCSPDVLDPASSAGNVYAGYSTTTGCMCNSPSLTDECDYLSDAQLSKLHHERAQS